MSSSGEGPKSTPRMVNIKSADGTILKAGYFAAAKCGPSALLFNQSNRTRKPWEEIAHQLVALTEKAGADD
jgi:hypothetical protein